MRTRYVNGRVYTSDEKNPWVDSFVVEDDVFTGVSDGSGSDEVDEVVDLLGRFVMPGMYDLHVHPDLMLEPKYMGQIQTLQAPSLRNSAVSVSSAASSGWSDRSHSSPWFSARHDRHPGDEICLRLLRRPAGVTRKPPLRQIRSEFGLVARSQ